MGSICRLHTKTLRIIKRRKRRAQNWTRIIFYLKVSSWHLTQPFYLHYLSPFKLPNHIPVDFMILGKLYHLFIFFTCYGRPLLQRVFRSDMGTLTCQSSLSKCSDISLESNTCTHTHRGTEEGKKKKGERKSRTGRGRGHGEACQRESQGKQFFPFDE